MARKKRAARSAKPRSGGKATIIVASTRRRRRVSGTAVGKVHRRPRRRKSKGMLGSTGTLKQIGVLAVGMVGGAVATHYALRPLEIKLTAHYPQAGKVMGAAEILIGGIVAMKAKSPLLKGVGLGIMGGGVHTVMHQLNIGVHNPAISGADEYQTIRVPISGNYRQMMNGVIKDSNKVIDTAGVAGRARSGPDLYRSYLLAGTGGEEFDDSYFEPKGWNA